VSSPRPLTEDDRELIRLVARSHTNRQIAVRLGISTRTVVSRLARLHRTVGTATGLERDTMLARVRMTAWAYENGLMDGVKRDAAPADVPVELATELLDLCRAIVAERPRGDLRTLATRALRMSGRLQ
jgi:hypothetical protein